MLGRVQANTRGLLWLKTIKKTRSFICCTRNLINWKPYSIFHENFTILCTLRIKTMLMKLDLIVLAYLPYWNLKTLSSINKSENMNRINNTIIIRIRADSVTKILLFSRLLTLGSSHVEKLNQIQMVLGTFLRYINLNTIIILTIILSICV